METATGKPLFRISCLLLAVFAVAGAGGCSGSDSPVPPPGPQPATYDYEVPVSPTSPWPMMRRTRYNNGRSPVAPLGSGMPWSFRTGKGIFSTPVIGSDGSLLVGSADRNFYALDPETGAERWRLATGEIIDSAAAVARDGTILVPSGDGNLYALAPDGSVRWTFAAHHMAGQPDEHQGTHCGAGQPIGGPSNWFEGNAIIGPGGRIWAGNDNYRMYGLTSAGQEEVAFFTSAFYGAVWSAAATLPDGSAIFASMNTNLYRITANGDCLWNTPIGLMVSGTPALSDDKETVYCPSWDGRLYAVDAETGRKLWNVPTRELIAYSSPAVAADGTLYFGGSDGSLYAVSPGGQVLWTFDVMDPIRSSIALAGDGAVFFGAGDGALYALNPDGTRRWSFDATEEDRNDLNASPALGTTRAYIGSENGKVWGVPYSYCEEHPSDARCNLDPASDLPTDGAHLYYVTPGGRSFQQVPADYPVQRGAIFTVRLLVREAGQTRVAGFTGGAFQVRSTPPATFRPLPQGGDGQWMNLVPDGFLAADTEYALEVDAGYEIKGGGAGNVSGAFTFRTVAEDHPPPDLRVGAERTPAFEIRNLDPWQPPLLISINQIGWDSVDFLGSVIHSDGDRFVLWLTAGRPTDQGPVIDPATTSMIPLNGTLSGASFLLDGEFLHLITGGPPMELSELRIAAQFDAGGSFDAGTSLGGIMHCLQVPPLGWLLALAGMCNENGDFVAVGTIRGRPYDGPANRRPSGIALTGVTFDPRKVAAEFAATGYQRGEHQAAIVVVDTATGRVIPMDYSQQLAAEADGQGNLSRVVLNVPRGTALQRGTTLAIVVTDLFPLAAVLWE